MRLIVKRYVIIKHMENVLFVKKEKGMTSFDLCFKCRRVFNTRSIGHTGTLDPNATGVMIILIDKACKANQFLVADTKEYVAFVEYGYETDTLDIDGEVIQRMEYQAPTKEELLKAMEKFKGEIEQIPPMTSAIKVNGKKLIDYKREGKTVEIPRRKVEILKLELLANNDKGFIFKAKVSSGTYIRTLMQDILKEMGLIGTLVDLTRTEVGKIKLDDCDDLKDVLEGNYHLHSLYDIMKDMYECVEVTNVDDIKNGKRFKYQSAAKRLLLVNNQEVLAIYDQEYPGIYKCVRGLF